MAGHIDEQDAAAQRRVQFVLDFTERLVEHDSMSTQEELDMLERLEAAIKARIPSVRDEIESEEFHERVSRAD